MKNLFITLICLTVGVLGVQAQNGPKLQFKGGDTYDFGNIKEGPSAEHVFEFTNAGNEPLIIQNASASCGCTTPEWPKEPVLPGKKGKIMVRYNTQGRVGAFNKEVYIQSNAILPEGQERYILHIKGTVMGQQDPTAPKS